MQMAISGASDGVKARAEDRRMPAIVPLHLAGWLLVGCALPVSVWAADDYLSAIQSEAARVEARVIDPEKGDDVVVRPAEVSVDSPAVQRQVERADFEALLRKHYLGTYGFYRKLPERSREEVFQEYQKGADIRDIRQKIVSRLLQN